MDFNSKMVDFVVENHRFFSKAVEKSPKFTFKCSFSDENLKFLLKISCFYEEIIEFQLENGQFKVGDDRFLS